MRIAAVSDLHIGLDPATDAFHHDTSAYDGFLAELLGTHDRIVLLGDIITADHAWAWGPRFARAHLRRVLGRTPWLADRLVDPRVHYVHGNHDLVARDVLGAAERIVLGEAVRVMFVHGHQYDPIARGALPLANAGTWATGRMRAAGIPRVAQWFEDRDVSIKDRRFRGPHGPYARAADRLCETHDVAAVVMGHTHAARLDETTHGVSVNTGTCSCARFEWVCVDTTAREVTVHRDGDVVGTGALK
ncbi:MAG: metallophosphoesterase [Myxococcota bacterium]